MIPNKVLGRWASFGKLKNQARVQKKVKKISGTKFRALLEAGDDIPAWFSEPTVMDILYKAYPPRHKRGLVLFFYGLSGSGTMRKKKLKYNQILNKTKTM